jgi:4-hydroxy-3-methylbut-2-enyl diphosphate reductase
VRHNRSGRHVILIGHQGHPEIEGTLGQLPAGAASVVSSVKEVDALGFAIERPVAFAVQTTFAVEEAEAIIGAIHGRFSDVAGPTGSDICYATTNRQAAVRALAPAAQAVIIIGELFSSNACRLAEVARQAGCPKVIQVARASELDPVDRDGVTRLVLWAADATPV